MSAETIANKAFKQGTKALFDYDKHWASCFEPAPFLPMSRAEMDALGWDACDVIIVSGDAYVDHPSFGMAIIGRLLESQGFRVGIIAQPDWTSKDAFMTLGKPTIAWGVSVAPAFNSTSPARKSEPRSRTWRPLPGAVEKTA